MVVHEPSGAEENATLKQSARLAMALVFWGVYACGAETPVRDLVLWLDASDVSSMELEGGTVVRWRNRAPGFVNSFTSESDRRPRLAVRDGKPARSAVVFDGIDDVLRDVDFNRDSDEWTLVLVAAPFSGGGGLCTARSRDGHDYDPGFTVDLFMSGAEFNQVSVEGAGRIGGQQDQMGSACPYGTPHVIIVERGQREIRLFVDSAIEGTRPVNPARTVMDEVRLGARHYAGRARSYFEGEIAEVLLYTRVLTAEERAAVEQSRHVSSQESQIVKEQFMEAKAEQARNRMIPAKVVKEWSSTEAFCAEAGKDLSGLPVRTDLAEAIRLASVHLNSLFDADMDGEPFFYSDLRPDGTGEMHHSVNIGIPHVVGRCLLGSTEAELATGSPFPAEGLSILGRYCKSSFDNENHLNSYFDPEKEGKRFIEFHNMREGLYGLWALMTRPGSEWAREKATQMVRTLQRMTDENGRWSPALAAESGMEGFCFGVSVPNAARMVDPLLAFHRLTKDPVALELAERYARAGLAEMFDEDGRFTDWQRSSGHVHSITSALSGITDYAIVSKDKGMLDTCRRIMDVGVPEYHSSWGWGDEVFPEHPADERSRGEINQTGDVIRTALLLGDAGYPEYYELAERYLRGMILPTQYREEDLRAIMRENEDPKSDAERDVLRRSIGGCSMQLPNDRSREGGWPISTLDITSGAVHAMSECYKRRCVRSEATSRVIMLFDYEGEDLVVETDLPLKGETRFTVGTATRVELRIAPWVERDSVALVVDGEPREPHFDGGYLVVEDLKPGQRGVVQFPVPVKTESETVDGIEYTTTWAGSQIIAILPRGTVSPLPF
jgi:hypothetical protein